MAPDPFRIEAVGEQHVSTCIRLIVDSFSAYAFEQRLGNTNDTDGLKGAEDRHRRACQDHFEDTGLFPAIQCIHKHPETGKNTTVACAEWFIYPEPLPRNDTRGPSYLISGVWLPDEEAASVQQTFKPPLDLRAKWTTGRGYGLLTYMSTDPKWRRMGAATRCVQWGIERCRELGIPAYLEASKDGAPVYQGLGFEIVDMVQMEVEGEKIEFPAMMWWSPGTPDEQKRPLQS